MAQLTLSNLVNVPQLERWVAEFPEAELRSALAELKATREQVDAVIADFEQKIVFYESMKVSLGRADIPNTITINTEPTPVIEAEDSRPKLPKRAAVLRVLSADTSREMKVEEIRQHLIGMGVVSDSKADAHSLQVMIASMYKRGEIDRARQGYYRFLSPTSETNENGLSGHHRGPIPMADAAQKPPAVAAYEPQPGHPGNEEGDSSWR